MNTRSVPLRIAKKRRLSEIINAMLRLDAIFPKVRRLDEEFVQFILLVWLVDLECDLTPEVRSALTKMFEPELSFRADDFAHVLKQVQGKDLSQGYGKWLHGFLASGFPSEARARLLVRVTALCQELPDVHFGKIDRFLTSWETC